MTCAIACEGQRADPSPPWCDDIYAHMREDRVLTALRARPVASDVCRTMIVKRASRSRPPRDAVAWRYGNQRRNGRRQAARQAAAKLAAAIAETSAPGTRASSRRMLPALASSISVWILLRFVRCCPTSCAPASLRRQQDRRRHADQRRICLRQSHRPDAYRPLPRRRGRRCAGQPADQGRPRRHQGILHQRCRRAGHRARLGRLLALPAGDRHAARRKRTSPSGCPAACNIAATI